MTSVEDSTTTTVTVTLPAIRKLNSHEDWALWIWEIKDAAELLRIWRVVNPDERFITEDKILSSTQEPTPDYIYDFLIEEYYTE